jgi:hypothetical protein
METNELEKLEFLLLPNWMNVVPQYYTEIRGNYLSNLINLVYHVSFAAKNR